MAILVFIALQRGLDLGLRAELFGEKADLCEIPIDDGALVGTG
jgi:hypothetical protein